MRNFKIAGLGIVALGLLTTACSDDLTIDNVGMEEYTKAFIEQYGIPKEGHTFSMAERQSLKITSSVPRDVVVIATVSGKTYKFAEYNGVSGTTTLKFDVPRYATGISVYSDGMIIPATGASVNLDVLNTLPEVESRADDSPVVYQEYGNGCITPDEHNGFKVTNGGWKFVDTGWQINDYLNEGCNSTFVNERLSENNKFWGDNFGYGHLSLGLIYWRKSADVDFEIGIYKKQSNTYMPMYNTKTNTSGNASSSVCKFTTDYSKTCAQITFDYTGDEGTATPTIYEWNSSNTYNSFYTELGKDLTLKQQILDHYSVQADLDAFIEANDTPEKQAQFNLPEEQENNIEYWQKHDQYIYWLAQDFDATKRAKLSTFPVLRQFWGYHYAGYPFEYVYPHIVKDPEKQAENIAQGLDAETGLREIYQVTFRNAAAAQGSESMVQGATSLHEIKNHEIYNAASWGIDRYDPLESRFEDGDAEDFVLYVKNLNTNSIVYTDGGDGESSAKMFRWNKHLTNDQSGNKTLMYFDLDIDGNYDGNYDDLLIESAYNPVTPQTTEFEPYPWIIAVEDLGSTDDVDFNDIVFGISYTASSANQQTITIRPLAAGGIYPAYLMFTTPDEHTYVLGTEIHKWLGVPVDIYNTGAEFIESVNDVRHLQFKYDVQLQDAEFSLAGYKDAHWATNNVGGLWVMVDKENYYDGKLLGLSLKEFDLEEAKGVHGIQLVNCPANNTNGIVPIMICVGGEWEWPAERKRIEWAYPSWTQWLSNPDTPWYGEGVTVNDNMLTKRPQQSGD